MKFFIYVSFIPLCFVAIKVVKCKEFFPKSIFTRNLLSVERQLRNPVLFGIADSKPVENREQQIGSKFDIVVTYQATETLSYNMLVKPQLDKGKKVVMVIEFNSYEYRNLYKVSRGDYDVYLHKFIDEMLKDGNREVSIRPLHEFNADWYSWGTYRGGSNTPQEFIRAFRHVAYVFKNRGANVKIQLDYNCENPNEDKTPFIEWFPGEDVVDMILCNAYNRKGLSQWHTEWESFREIFENGYKQIAELPGNFPLGIGETSSTEEGDKVEWFEELFKDIMYDFPRLEEVDFFLINKGNRLWDLNSQSQVDIFGHMLNQARWQVGADHL